MFDDKRSKRVILTAHCILNQNAKIDRCAHYPGAIKKVVATLIASGIGIVQMPCPELLYLGLDRQVDKDAATTIESEDTRVAQRMNEELGRTLSRRLARNLVHQIDEYERNGFQVVGLLGINGSPTCGVESIWADAAEKPGAGVFIQSIQEECRRKNISLPMRGIKAYEIPSALDAIRELTSHVRN